MTDLNKSLAKRIKHFLSVGPKSIQSRVYDGETDELVSFVKMPLSEVGLVDREWVGLTDEEIQNILDCKRHDLVNIKKAEQILKEKNT